MWHPSSELEALRCQLELAELEAGGVAYGLSAPADPTVRRRDRLPHEAHVDFDAIEAELDAARDRVAGVALRLRPAVLERLLMHVDAASTVPLRTIAELRLPGAPVVPGVEQLVAAAAGVIAVELHDVAAAAAVRVHTELIASGMPAARIVAAPRRLAAAPAGSGPSETLAAQALRVAATPVSQLLDAAQTAAAATDGPDVRPEAVARALADAAAALSDRGVVDVAGQAVNRAAGLGRSDAIDSLDDDVAVGAGDNTGGAGGDGRVLIYASELIDRSTCYPCALIDGQEYDTEAAAAEDYPFGQYAACLGGGRCRGMLVYVWSPEAAPTIGMPR